MITMTHLDKEDIHSIIAHHFDVPYENVMIDCHMETVGYGMNEHKEPMVRAVVTTYKDRKVESKPKNEESFLSWIYLDGTVEVEADDKKIR